MIFKILLRYIFGYVNISVQGYYIERFINVCISKNIFLWNTKIERSTYAHANVGLQDFKSLKAVARKTNCRIKINSKQGIPFLMNKYRKRKIFAVLLASFFILMFIQSRFIWNIQVEGNERINTSELIEELESAGLKVGVSKSKINSQEIINKVRLDRADIAWMNLDLRGTNIIVQIVETTEKPKIIPLDEYCNVVSNKTAQIVKITANSGTIVANPGDIVTEGSVLIGGWMEGKYTGTRYVHANR